jgi:DNA-binding response OmpR family regulator
MGTNTNDAENHPFRTAMSRGPVPEIEPLENVLIIEDDRAVQRVLRRLFRSAGYAVHTAGNGIAGLEIFPRVAPSAIVLDLAIPGMSGQDVCRELTRIAPATPIVILSANSRTATKVQLLEIGASDYVTKPFSPRELVARLRAATRRRHQLNMGDILVFDDVTVNFSKMETMRNGQVVSLSARNFKLLAFLLRNSGYVISRQKLQDEICKNKHDRSVDNQIMLLRKRLERDPSTPVHFRTVHGVGYKFVP